MYVMGSYTRDGLYIEHFTYKYQITFTCTHQPWLCRTILSLQLQDLSTVTSRFTSCYLQTYCYYIRCGNKATRNWTEHHNSTHSLSISKHSGIISFHTTFHQWFHTLFINLCLMTKIKEKLLKINNLPSSMKYWVYFCMEKEIIRHEVFFLNLPAIFSFPKPIVNFLHQH